MQYITDGQLVLVRAIRRNICKARDDRGITSYRIVSAAMNFATDHCYIQELHVTSYL